MEARDVYKPPRSNVDPELGKGLSDVIFASVISLVLTAVCAISLYYAGRDIGFGYIGSLFYGFNPILIAIALLAIVSFIRGRFSFASGIRWYLGIVCILSLGNIYLVVFPLNA